ncbi:CHAP domain-containing protein [Azospirillum argentinense]|uniref:CHAP domain-containing protein n=1 Tax=Azospirillum argentinense TaxID=2970906 RepID=A0A4D8PC10_9PROT|nr:CHAP domain-containing protein [Azospirillum argentinense]QCN94844.1 CHAP domain-containing protein [Azospirillum argentinense]
MRSKGIALCASFAAFIALSPFTISQAQAQDGDCVRTLRSISDFEIRGDAWTWWNTAADQYERDKRPALGSVLVFKRSQRLGRGHVSLVSHIIDRRTIEVDHSWLDGRGLRRNMRVVDVSPRNDWTAVRVWHEPSDQLGLRVYTTYGFILPEGEEAEIRQADSRNAGIGSTFAVAPQGRAAPKPAAGPRLMEASLKGHAVAVPGRKPQVLTASLTLSGKGTAAKMAPPVVTAVLPARKPTQPAAQKGVEMVASTEGIRAVLPPRKPGSGDSTVAELTR